MPAAVGDGLPAFLFVGMCVSDCCCASCALQVVVIAHCQPCRSRATDGYDEHLVQAQRVVAFACGQGAGASSTSSLVDAALGSPTAKNSTGSAGRAGTHQGMQPVHNLKQLAAAVLACREGEIRLELADGLVLVFGASQVGGWVEWTGGWVGGRGRRWVGEWAGYAWS